MSWTDALGWALIHFLWQGTLITALLMCALIVFRHAGPRIHYGASCAAMLLMLTCVPTTLLAVKFGLMQSHSAPQSFAGVTSFDGAPRAPRFTPILSPQSTGDYLPILMWIWLAGVIGLTIRSIGGWALAQRFARRQTRLADVAWNDRFLVLAQRLAISRPVKLTTSSLAQVPAVVGWIKPIVLVPASVFSGLPSEQVEALLAHELAHILRNDYLVNLAQTAAETLLFYHPAVWWVSNNIRNQREHCCDDLAAEACGDAQLYIKALTELEAIRVRAPHLVLAANGGSLLHRARRLLCGDPSFSPPSSAWIVGLGIALTVSVAGLAAHGPIRRIHRDLSAAPELALADRFPQSTASVTAQTAGPGGQSGSASKDADKRTNVQAPKEQPKAASESARWLDKIEAAGYRNLSVNKLIEMKVQGVTADYIRQMKAEGLNLTADQLVACRVQGVTPDFIDALKQIGLRDLKPNDLIAMKIQGAAAAWIRQVQASGFPNVSVQQAITLRVQGITPEFIREVRGRFPDVTINQLIELKLNGIFAP